MGSGSHLDPTRSPALLLPYKIKCDLYGCGSDLKMNPLSHMCGLDVCDWLAGWLGSREETFSDSGQPNPDLLFLNGRELGHPWDWREANDQVYPYMDVLHVFSIAL